MTAKSPAVPETTTEQMPTGGSVQMARSDSTPSTYETFVAASGDPDVAVTVLYTHETKADGAHTDLRTLSDIIVRMNAHGDLYVVAYDDMRHDTRSFSLDRIQVVSTWRNVGQAAKI